MKCKAFEELIQKKLDGDIAPDDRRRLEGHLADCADCRKALSQHEWIAETLAAASPAGEARVSAAVMERIRARRPRLQWGLAVAAAAACVVLAVLVLVGRSASKPTQPSVTIARQAGTISVRVQALVSRAIPPIETPDVLGASRSVLEHNVETLKEDARTTREMLAGTIEEFTRDLPLL